MTDMECFGGLFSLDISTGRPLSAVANRHDLSRCRRIGRPRALFPRPGSAWGDPVSDRVQLEALGHGAMVLQLLALSGEEIEANSGWGTGSHSEQCQRSAERSEYIRITPPNWRVEAGVNR